jgi:polyisoprenoid-binding protein YceI
MKKLILLFAIALIFFNVEAQTKKIDVSKSKIEWTGSKVTGKHTGDLSFKSGNLEFENGVLKGGSFVVDMTSMTVTDIKGESAAKLLAHLKSDDFFSVDTHKESRLEITEVAPVNLTQYVVVGKLTIKGITQPVKFEAVVKDNRASAVVVVDRTEYGIKYGSGSFFDNLGDKAIKNNFELNINLFY